MILYKITKNKAQKINSKKFINEKELQKFVENNLEELFELKFIASEFGTRFCIDTICFDTKTNSAVIIEFKENQSYSVIDQGFTYLNFILTHKGDLQLKINKVLGKDTKIDWSQTKIIFIARNFNKFQVEATRFKGIPISLVEYNLYDDGIIGFNFIEAYQETDLKAVMSDSKIMQKVREEIKPYRIEEALKDKPKKIKNIFNSIREKVLQLDNSIIESMSKSGTIYKNNGLTFLYLDPKINEIMGTLRLKHQKNLKNILVNRNVKEGAVFKTRFKIKSLDEAEDALSFIKKAFENTL